MSPSWATMVVAVLTTIALGLAAWGVTAWRSTPTALQTATTKPGTLRVSATAFADPRDATLTPTLRAGATLHNASAGVLTDFRCTPGQVIASGTRVGTIGRSPIVTVHTAKPLWRALTVGNEGDDVAGLTKELARLGRLPATQVSTRLSREGLRAAMKLAGRSGYVLALGDLLWIPSQSVRVGTCEVQVGQTVQEGATLFTQSQALVSLQVGTESAGSVPGARVVTLLGRRAPVVQGRVQDPALLAAVTASDLLATTPAREGEPVTLPATVELAKPLAVVSVPAGSVKVDGSSACVSVAGASSKVTVVSSSLGRTLVSFSQPPSSIDLTPPTRCTS